MSALWQGQVCGTAVDIVPGVGEGWVNAAGLQCQERVEIPPEVCYCIEDCLSVRIYGNASKQEALEEGCVVSLVVYQVITRFRDHTRVRLDRWDLETEIYRNEAPNC